MEYRDAAAQPMSPATRAILSSLQLHRPWETLERRSPESLTA